MERNKIIVNDDLRKGIMEALKGDVLDLNKLSDLQAMGGIKPFRVEVIENRNQVVNDGNYEDEPIPDIIELSAELKKKLLKAIINKGELDPSDFPEITAREPKIQVVDSEGNILFVDLWDHAYKLAEEDRLKNKPKE